MLVSAEPDDFFRTAPQVVGEFAELPGLGATVTRVDAEGRPKVVHFELDRNLNDPSVTWIVEGRSGFTEVIPPGVGFGVRLPP